MSLTGGIPDGNLGEDVPKQVEDLPWCLASLLTFGAVTEEDALEDGEFVESLEGILRALFANAEELIQSLEDVHWESGTESHNEYDGNYSHTFTYDPVNGASYFVEEVPGMEDDEDEAEDW